MKSLKHITIGIVYLLFCPARATTPPKTEYEEAKEKYEVAHKELIDCICEISKLERIIKHHGGTKNDKKRLAELKKKYKILLKKSEKLGSTYRFLAMCYPKEHEKADHAYV